MLLRVLEMLLLRLLLRLLRLCLLLDEQAKQPEDFILVLFLRIHLLTLSKLLIFLLGRLLLHSVLDLKQIQNLLLLLFLRILRLL